jgi:hypothetical protein
MPTQANITRLIQSRDLVETVEVAEKQIDDRH